MEEDRKLSAKEAAAYLGYKNEKWLYALVRKKAIPFHKRPGSGEVGKGNRGGGLYFYEHELDKWLSTGRRAT
jgi:predicted DNA-binding transcriptional regulator AlpA